MTDETLQDDTSRFFFFARARTEIRRRIPRRRPEKCWFVSEA